MILQTNFIVQARSSVNDIPLHDLMLEHKMDVEGEKATTLNEWFAEVEVRDDE